MIAGGLVIRFQIAFCAVMLLQLARHVDVLILLRRQLRTRGKEIATILQRLIKMNTPLVGVTHIVRRHVVGGFANQMFEQIAIGLGDADRLESHAVFPQRRFHILECLTHAAVFRQQVVAQQRVMVLEIRRIARPRSGDNIYFDRRRNADGAPPRPDRTSANDTR